MHEKQSLGEIKTTGQLRACLGRILRRLEDGKIDASDAHAACKVANAINQTFAEETKAILAQKEIGGLQVGFGQTLLGAPEQP